MPRRSKGPSVWRGCRSRASSTRWREAVDRVAHVGSGSGLFTRPITRAIGATGVAYGVDIDVGLERPERSDLSLLDWGCYSRTVHTGDIRKPDAAGCR